MNARWKLWLPLTLIASGPELQVMGGGFFNILSPGTRALVMFGAPFQDRESRALMASFPGFIQLQAALLDSGNGRHRGGGEGGLVRIEVHRGQTVEARDALQRGRVVERRAA